MSWPELPLFLRKDELPTLPKGWRPVQINNIAVQLDVGKRYDQKTVVSVGKVPVINQSEDDLLGYHNDDPGVLASPARPVVTFANHTCAMRLMREPFSSIQNVFPRVGRDGVCDTVFFYYATKGRVRITDYKGHHPLFRQAWIALPPLNTQLKIVSILSAYDDLIENNLRRIKILEEMARLIYREWFVHFRFPGHEKVKMVESELGSIPRGWEVARLGDIAGINLKSIRRGDEPDEIVYVDIKSVSTGSVDDVTQMRFEEAPGRARRKASHGDIIWSTVRPNRRSYSLVLHPPPSMVLSTGFAVISPLRAPYTYLYLALTTDEFVGYLVNHTRGAAYPAVITEDFENARLLLPPLQLLDLFNEITEPLYELRHCLGSARNNLRSGRDLLLPELISGEIEVSDLPIATEEPVA